MLQNIHIDNLTLDPRLQMRAQMDEDAIKDYSCHCDKLPPVKVMLDSEGRFWPWDGYHTIAAYRTDKQELIPCEVTEGQFRDAQLAACGANPGHGLRRTAADKRKAISVLLADEEWAANSDRWIGDACHVTHDLVGKVRAEMEAEKSKRNSSTGENASSSGSDKPKPKRRGKDGKSRPATTQKSTTFTMCDRCSRQGKPSCESCRGKAADGKTPKPKSTGKAEADPKMAGLPKDVANALADTWHLESAKLLSKIAKECKSAFTWSVWLDASVLDHLKAAEECFLTAAPKKKCSNCDGQKKVDGKPCGKCRQGGYLGSQA